MSYMLKPKEESKDKNKDKVPNLYVGLTFIILGENYKQLKEINRIS